ncbi:MAG: hypothetical protein R2729_31130 [Bryobacteraceae bacterium]
MPFLTNGPDGAVYLSWTEPTGAGAHALRLARWRGSRWSSAETIAEGRNWFVNWGDFGSVTVRPDGSMLAHWLVRAEGGGQYGYGIRVAMREATRPVWRDVHAMSRDEKVDYAGFLTFAPGTGAAVYLSPPAQQGAVAAHGGEHEHRKTVRFIEFDASGSVSRDQELDADVCSCCQTALAKTAYGWIAAYRDHAPGEIRDIAVTRLRNGRWTKPEPLHRDGWNINGCPTDGPSIASNRGGLAIVWLTRAGGEARVQAALSGDDGLRFRRPIRLDGGNPLGRPAIQKFDTESYLATWLEKTGDDGVEIRLRKVAVSGELSRPVVLTRVPVGRASGFPKIALTGNRILIAWRDERVRAAMLTTEEFTAKERK